jgi:hypothetical protein
MTLVTQPGYTADNLTEKGVHEVTARRFVLVAAVS